MPTIAHTPLTFIGICNVVAGEFLAAEDDELAIFLLVQRILQGLLDLWCVLLSLHCHYLPLRLYMKTANVRHNDTAEFFVRLCAVEKSRRHDTVTVS